MDALQLGALGVALDRDRFPLGRVAEQLGYGALWVAGGQLDTLEPLVDLTRRTTRARIVPGIISAGVHAPTDVAAVFHRLDAEAPGRFVVGVGGPQAPRSLATLRAWLDHLDDLAVPRGRRLLAALGPRKLEIARDRTAGAITLLTTPAHTAAARTTLGADRTLVVDLFVVLADPPERARDTARGTVSFLLGVPGYRNNLVRLGFTDHDIATVSDRLLDAVVAHGDADTIAARVAEHRAAGADHVVLSPLTRPDRPVDAGLLERLATACAAGT